MKDIIKQIEIAQKQPLTPENLNYIGDLYLKKGDKQTAISYFYEIAEKLHISQKDRKLAIYKKILNISTSESKAYEKIISIFARTGLIADEKKYLLRLANLYQNTGEYNKLDALFRRIREIDPENQIAKKYFTKGKQNSVIHNKDAFFVEKNTVTKESICSPLSLPTGQAGSPFRGEDGSNSAPPLRGGDEGEGDVCGFTNDRTSRSGEKLTESLVNGIQERIKTIKSTVISRLGENPKKISLYVGISFLLILLSFSIYLYKIKIEYRNSSEKIKEAILQTGDYEVTVMEMTNSNEFTDKISDEDRKDNLFYTLSLKAKKKCFDDSFASSPHLMASFIDNSGNQFMINDIKGLDKLTRIIYRTNICGKDAGAVFIRVVLAHKKKSNYSGISINGLEKDRPILITWN